MERWLVCGSRGVADRTGVWVTLDRELGDRSTGDVTLVVGGARGADEIARQWAVARHLDHEVYPADWERHGRSAGFKRNLLMLDTGVDRVIAFIDRALPDSRGTCHTVTTARHRGIDTKVYRRDAR